MSFYYEVVVEEPLGEWFRRKFLQSVTKTKCCEMFKLMAPGIPNLWQFKVGKEVFTLSFSYEPGEQKERLVIESMTMDLRDVILLTVESNMAEYIKEFLLPLTKVSGDEMEVRLKNFLKELDTGVVPPPAT